MFPWPAAEALRVPNALRDEYGKQPTRPLMVAKALDMQPGGSTFRKFTGAAIAYGLTEGAAQSDSIGLTDLGRRAVAPTVEGDDVLALREAVLRPRVVREFLTKYDGSKVPSASIAHNVLEELGVPLDAAERVLALIIENAQSVGFLQEINGQQFVHLDGPVAAAGSTAAQSATHAIASADPTPLPPEEPQVGAANFVPSLGGSPVLPPAANDLTTNKRVFVTHGKNRAIVDQLKEVLTFGGFDPLVSVEREAVAKPLPDKVMDDMRSCAAGIVHVGAERTLLDRDGKEHTIINENVLIEIGAALALYGRNFILLVERGVTLPSNLQGLYEVRYEGDKLDYDATMKLLRAFNDFKSSAAKP